MGRSLILAGSIVLAAGLAATPASAAMLTADVCKSLARHEAAGNVDYRPGYTVRGGRVVRASARPKSDRSPMPTRIDVTTLLEDRYLLPKRRLQAEAFISRFIVRRDGVLSYAGQPLSLEDQQQISAICRRAFGE